MSRLLRMVGKDLRRRRRAPLAMVVLLSFPLIFTGLVALTFGGGPEALPKVELLIEDRDQSLVSEFLVSAFGREEMAEYFAVRQVGAQGREMMERGEASALLRIPEGFGKELLRGQPTTLELVRNPAQGIMPEIAEQVMIVLADVLSSGARLLREPLGRLAPCLEGDDCELSESDVLASSAEVYRTLKQSRGVLFPPVIELETVDLGAEEEEEEEPAGVPSRAIFLLVLPGMAVWALFMLGDAAMRDVLTESVAGTLRRQLSGPVRPWEVVVSKALYTAALALISLLLLSVIGWLAAEQGIDLVAFAVLSLALIVAVTGFAAAVYGVARTERQGATFSSIVLLIFGFVGGSFLQVEWLPAAVRRFSPLSPFYWGTTGYRELIADGGSLADVFPNVAVLVTLGTVLLVAGAALLGRKIRRGAAA